MNWDHKCLVGFSQKTHPKTIKSTPQQELEIEMEGELE